MATTPDAPREAVIASAASRWRTNLVAGVLAIGMIVVLTWWVMDRIAYVRVTDARVAGTMITVASRVAGWIDNVAVGESDTVDAGALLISIDNREARLLLAERAARETRFRAEAQTLHQRRAMIDAQTASRLESRRSRVNAAEALVRVAEAEYERLRRLGTGGSDARAGDYFEPALGDHAQRPSTGTWPARSRQRRTEHRSRRPSGG